MNTLWTLSLTGSCMLLFYFACGRLQKGAGRWRRYWILVVSLLYLIPLRRLQDGYLGSLRNTGAQIFKSGKYDFDFYRDYVELTTVGGEVYPSAALRLDGLFLLGWLAAALGLLIYRSGRYFLKRRRLLACCLEEKTGTGREALDRLCGEMGIRRRVRLFRCPDVSPVSMGLFCPVIILPEELEDKKGEMVLRHELAHIKNCDVLLFMLIGLVTAVHWFNPAVYLLRREWRRISELDCDREAVSGYGLEERRAYAMMLVEESSKPGSAGRKFQMPWTSALAGEAERLKERIEYIMEEKAWSGRFKAYVSGILLAVSLFVSSLTVFAYKETYRISEVSEADAKEASSLFLKKPDIWISSLSLSQKGEAIFYEGQIPDEESDICAAGGAASGHGACGHTFENCAYMKQTRNPDGSCKVEHYGAERCTKCGDVAIGNRIAVSTYEADPCGLFKYSISY